MRKFFVFLAVVSIAAFFGTSCRVGGEGLDCIDGSTEDANCCEDVVVEDDGVPARDVGEDTSVCIPNCNGRECGNNGCFGGSCGSCEAYEACVLGSCSQLICDTDAPCPDWLVCDNRGFCRTPCRDNHDCSGDQKCSSDGLCITVCVPDCFGRECGSDYCGGICGVCDTDESCQFGKCKDICTPDCNGRECGPNGCGGSCGSCGSTESCNNSGQCIPDVAPSPLYLYADVSITVRRATSSAWVNMGTFSAREAVPITETMTDSNGLVLVMICAVGSPYAQVFYVTPGLGMDGNLYYDPVPPAIGSFFPGCSEPTATAKIKQGACALLTIGCP